MIETRRYLIAGRVQGVGFRFFALEAAQREGLSGYVRNLSDRRVEAVVEGDAAAVQRFELAIRRGPVGARVDAVSTELLPPSGRFTGFAVE